MLAATPNIEDTTTALWPLIGIIVVAVGLWMVVRWLRKRLRQSEAGPPGGFTLGDLRDLVKAGKMTPLEFERAKNKVLDATKRATAVKPAQETVVQKEMRIEDRG